MEDSQLRQLKYLIESQAPWQPDKLVLPTWERGLLTKKTCDYLVEASTIDMVSAFEL